GTGRGGGRGYHNSNYSSNHHNNNNHRGRSDGDSSGRHSSNGRGGGGGGGGRVYAGRGGRGGRGENQGGPPSNHPASSVPYGCLPSFLPGASSLVEQLDQKMLVVLRDGRHLVGTLRTFDQFSNMVLEDTSERRILVVPRDDGNSDGTICYQADIKLGLYIVRGDSVVLMGEVDDDEEQESHDKLRLVSLEELEQLEEEEQKRKEEKGETVEQIDWEFDLDLVV
ncbi:hypothetical protein ACHAXS_010682, partial [Conticribra weissflogii]